MYKAKKSNQNLMQHYLDVDTQYEMKFHMEIEMEMHISLHLKD